MYNVVWKMLDTQQYELVKYFKVLILRWSLKESIECKISPNMGKEFQILY